MFSLLFCILYSRLLIIQNNDRELTYGRPGLDGRIILIGSSRNRVGGRGLDFCGLGYRQWQALVDMLMNRTVSYNMGNLIFAVLGCYATWIGH